MILYAIYGFLHLLLGIQIQMNEWKLLSGHYNYPLGKAQFVTYVCGFLAIVIATKDVLFVSKLTLLFSSLLLLTIFAICEWGISIINPKNAINSWFARFMIILGYAILYRMFCAQTSFCEYPVMPFILVGIYLRNTPFGIAHGKKLWLARLFSRKPNYDFSVFSDIDEPAPDCIYAGCKHVIQASQCYDVTDHGVIPNSHKDQSAAIQAVINMVGEKGGGKVFFPRGRYMVNSTGNGFLQINHSNVIIEGETNNDGVPLVELVNCASTVRGHKNPWISPFMIITGETLQPSNEFWGLQFRKRKNSFTQSNSPSDPGSDGDILTPDFATHIISDSKKGESLLHVEDSSKVGKYIMLGMYNTSADGNLIRDILGMDTLRPEWTVANRAGEEEAPSYQWLVEVDHIIDEHTIRLCRPLLRDCLMQYEPAIYNVQMLENIAIRNLRLNSLWSGLFRHHGFPLYYSIPCTQQMDYGWNAINMKRVAHGEVSNVTICNFTNPLYVMDSRNVTVKNINIKGYDGHQGLKIYVHACDNLFENITFTNHFADMMGGEGNAYANVFRNVAYLNPVFKPVDYDFHGFSEAPMSPPADNIFTKVYGFRYMKSAGTITHLPSCAQGNTWHDTITEGERKGDLLFYVMSYRQKRGLLRYITAIGYSVAMMQKTHNISVRKFMRNINEKLIAIDSTGIPRDKHKELFPTSRVWNIRTSGVV